MFATQHSTFFRLDGRIVRDLVCAFCNCNRYYSLTMLKVRADGKGFLKGLGLWFLLAIPSTYTNSMVPTILSSMSTAHYSSRSDTSNRNCPFDYAHASPATRMIFISHLHLTCGTIALGWRASTSTSLPTSSRGQKRSPGYSQYWFVPHHMY